MRRLLLAGLALALGGCSDELADGVMVLVTGLETETLTGPPPIESVEIVRQDPDGSEEVVETLAVLPGDIPRFSMSGGVTQYEARGLDDEGEVRVRGRSFLVNPSALREYTLPLFVGRVGEFSRPNPLVTPAGAYPNLAGLGGRYLLITGESLDGTLNIGGFDFGWWSPATGERFECPDSSCAVLSMAVVRESIALLVGEDWAFVRDFANQAAGTLELPPGLDSYSQIAGGATVQTPDGGAYIVGPTRTEPSQHVVQIAEDIAGHELLTERSEAAAAWVDDRGLLVWGGSEAGPGGELLALSASESVALPFAADPTAGAAVVPIDGSLVLRVGGTGPDNNPAPTVVLDLSCAADCVPRPFGGPIGLTHAQGFRLRESVLVVGEDADGFTSACLVTEQGNQQVQLHERRTGARAFHTFLDQVVVVGGTLEDGTDALSVELFTL